MFTRPGYLSLILVAQPGIRLAASVSYNLCKLTLQGWRQVGDILKPCGIACGVVRHQIGRLTIPISGGEGGGVHRQDGMRDEVDGGAH